MSGNAVVFQAECYLSTQVAPPQTDPFPIVNGEIHGETVRPGAYIVMTNLVTNEVIRCMPMPYSDVIYIKIHQKVMWYNTRHSSVVNIYMDYLDQLRDFIGDNFGLLCAEQAAAQ